MAVISVAILGLGRLGASVALALKRYSEQKDAQHTFNITCADLRAGVREDAQKLGLPGKLERDLFKAAAGRDILVLALPYADGEAAYRGLADELRPGAVLLDMAPLKLPPLAWAQKYLPPAAHLVGITPILNPRYLFDGLDDTAHAQADLFDKGTMLLTPGVTCAPEAVELASDFAALLGAKPHFLDPAEHDSLTALTDGLPSLLGVALFSMAARSRGWPDAQRLTNPAFGRLTRPLYDIHPDDLRDDWLDNRANLLLQLDGLLETLRALRGALAANDRAAVEALLAEAADAYSAWINRRVNARWEDETGAPQPPPGGTMLNTLMGGFLARRLTGRQDDDAR